MTDRVAGLDKEILKSIMAHECSHISLKHMGLRTSMLGSLLMLALIPSGLSLFVVVANFFVLWAVRSMEFGSVALSNLSQKITNEINGCFESKMLNATEPKRFNFTSFDISPLHVR